METGARAIYGVVIGLKEVISQMKKTRTIAENIQARIVQLRTLHDELVGTSIEDSESFLSFKVLISELEALSTKIADKSRFKAFFTSGKDKKALTKLERMVDTCISDLKLSMEIEALKVQANQSEQIARILQSQDRQLQTGEELRIAVRSLNDRVTKRIQAHRHFLTNPDARSFYESYYSHKASMPLAEFWNSFKIEVEFRLKKVFSEAEAAEIKTQVDVDGDGYVDVKELNAFFKDVCPLKNLTFSNKNAFQRGNFRAQLAEKAILMPRERGLQQARSSQPKRRAASTNLVSRKPGTEVKKIAGIMDMCKGHLQSMQNSPLTVQLEQRLSYLSAFVYELSKASNLSLFDLSRVEASMASLYNYIGKLDATSKEDKYFKQPASKTVLNEFDGQLGLVIRQFKRLLNCKLPTDCISPWVFVEASLDEPYFDYEFGNPTAKMFHDKYFKQRDYIEWEAFWAFLDFELSQVNKRSCEQTEVHYKELCCASASGIVTVNYLDRFFNAMGKKLSLKL
mmetsp:Transcript_1189/g.2929  ORF Transcript_1189/g.2929 Transcript_1189/m.2929 type:complete len:512 (-) Transcript_1189:398-1933(-)